MRHAQRRNLRNGTIVLIALACLLTCGALVVLRGSPEVITVVKYRDVPGVCPGPVEKDDGLINRIFRHKRHAPAPRPPIVCGPDARVDEAGGTHSVPEPSSIALLVGGVAVAARFSRR